MGNRNIAIRLTGFTASQKMTVAKLYSYKNVVTDRVCKLLQALQYIVENCDQLKYKSEIKITHDEVTDHYNILQQAVTIYKLENKVNTIPADFTIYQLSEAIRNSEEIGVKEIVKQVIDIINEPINEKIEITSGKEIAQNIALKAQKRALKSKKLEPNLERKNT
jgi:hypothetical protein